MTNPQRGASFLCPCGCEKEYGVPLPDGWMLVPTVLDDDTMNEFDEFVAGIAPDRAWTIQSTARIGIKYFLNYHGSPNAKGVPTNG